MRQEGALATIGGLIFFAAALAVLLLYFFFTLRNGSVIDGYMYLYRGVTDDGLYHIGNVAQIINNPSLVMKNIHFLGSSFYHHDFSLYFIALLSYLTKIELVISYCKLYFPLVGFILILSLWGLTYRMYKNRGISLLVIFLSFFSHDLSFIVPLKEAIDARSIEILFGWPYQGWEIFLGKDPGPLLYNPTQLGSVTAMIVACYILLKTLQERTKFFFWLSVFSFAALAKFKGTTYSVVMASLLVTAFLAFLRGERLPLKMLCGSTLISLPFYLPYFALSPSGRGKF